jgi:predicted nucleic acid-binding protein
LISPCAIPPGGSGRDRGSPVRKAGRVIIEQIIYAKFALRYDTIDEVDQVPAPDEFRRESLPCAAAFAASKALLRDRRAGGAHEKVLPDFLIGAQAAIGGFKPLTRDPAGHYRYLPMIELVTADTYP